MKFLIDFNEEQINKPKIVFKSLSEFRIEYEEYVKANLSKKYLHDVKTTFNQLTEFIEDIYLPKINPQQLEKFISHVFNRSKYQARRNYINLKSAFNKAIIWGYITTNPMNKLKQPKIPSNNPLFINESELNLIMKNEPNQTLKEIYLFAFHTGMRLSEITNVKWNQISLTDKIIRVINTNEFTTKGKKERKIPINETLIKMLMNRLPKIINLNNSDYVFTKKGFKFNNEYVSKNFKKALRQVKELDSKIHFHDLRHSFASNMAKKGVSLFIIKELLGHQDIKTTQIYSHLTVDSLRSAVKMLEG